MLAILATALPVAAHAPDDRLLAGMKALRNGRSPHPMIEAGACRRFADAAEARLDKRLADERGG
ncbi:hypothetical protein ACNI3Q_06345 [Sphingomonas sp. FW199]|uniref:hypothetical protein n=1 Tax=Sphingomonas sp. FW199 TaxID=3400217 RepID=UPI003CFAB53E